MFVIFTYNAKDLYQMETFDMSETKSESLHYLHIPALSMFSWRCNIKGRVYFFIKIFEQGFQTRWEQSPIASSTIT